MVLILLKILLFNEQGLTVTCNMTVIYFLAPKGKLTLIMPYIEHFWCQKQTHRNKRKQALESQTCFVKSEQVLYVYHIFMVFMINLRITFYYGYYCIES